ncbi:hypothetical protein O0I10_003163 [Lichtheimia ornata]|uniref:Uncharacterized protein n=1 Tax=Lichtheimia ornata TaxID=688661 RepID=A0AAD7VB82_9FUNG|nr:uncharacterized protein O0I10_003163 [Lichtheimia ornata]KAJ8660941.1 hypothetical protein O0I10_003163 [Lichtheimia ornata]
MARFISLTLATLLSMAVFAQAAPTGAASSTDVNGQVPQQQQPNGGTSIAAPNAASKRSNEQVPQQQQPNGGTSIVAPNAASKHSNEQVPQQQPPNGGTSIAAPNAASKRSNEQAPQQQPPNGGTSIAAPNAANKRSNDITTNQPATAGTSTSGKQQTGKRSTTDNGPAVDENTNVPEDANSKVKGQEEKRSASAHQSDSGNASGGKQSIGKRCNKDVAGAEQGQPPVNAGEQEGAAATAPAAGDQQDGALDGITKRSDNEIKNKTQHEARDNDGVPNGHSVEGTTGHGQGDEKVEKRHNKGKHGNNKQNKGAQAQGNQQGQPGQPGQQAAAAGPQ